MSHPKNSIQRFLIAALTALLAITTEADETITYIHWDALGSPVAATDEDGNVVWREAYRPYGERINDEAAAGPHSRWYTGHPQDADTGLVYAGARYYDPVVGRFLAIDPVGVKEDNLHSFNRYAYANNNPYAYIDPDGREGVGAAFVMEDEDRFTGAFGTSGSVEQGTQQVATILETADNVSSVVMPAKGAVTFVGKQAGKAIKKSLTKGPKANNGYARKHGGNRHNDAIDQRANQLRQDPSVSNIRKNQQQVDVDGNKVGTNRPDLQFDKGGCHHCIEFDTVPRNSARHGEVIRRNDPNARVELNQL